MGTGRVRPHPICGSMRRKVDIKRILIEWLYHDGKGNECPHYNKASEIIENAVQTMRPYLRTMQVQLHLREVRPIRDEMGPSPR